SAQVTKELMKESLVQFKKLPPNKRRPGGIKVEDHGPLDEKYARVPPTGGLVLSVNTRILDQKKGAFSKGVCTALGGDHSARDHMWIQADEVKELVPAKREAGFKY